MQDKKMKRQSQFSLSLTLARLTPIALLCLSSVPQQSYAQSPSFQQQTHIKRQAVPDENVLARLVWSTMIALDNANRTNNYTVLNSLGSEEFQRRNTSERLSGIFSNLRQNRIDLGRTVLSTPSYYRPPEILSDGSLRLRGGFDYRPKSIRFDLIYSNIGGGWQISAISVVEMDASEPKQ